ncbi:conserved Plasmodium membrane protein, unknown function [Plasmodium gallinaceum]|uniref:Uncharacterized protein n=1 Tax=Plasmodium gallinaceum TaxID=5849 RepID=A0A1J1GYH9_PLAGA|nr:conserved Plasmodium membrane protein, unknown function [Plasmodium gallinaceum]CRG97525.1 conserved Plasmodium membrane protein, unknown function [Plasmodium gallinaceum]
MSVNKKKTNNEDSLTFLNVYSDVLFKYTEENKKKNELSETFLLREKIRDGKRLIKINIDIILIIVLFFVLCSSTNVIKIKKFQNYIYNNLNESKAYSESFYKSLSDDIKKINDDFSYEPRKKDYTIFKNISNKFELSSWIKNTFVEKVSKEKFLNNNILFGKCWRISMRLYKKKENISDNIYKDKKLYELYPDNSFSYDLENAQNLTSLYFDVRWRYNFSKDLSYKKIGGLYQIICESDHNKIQEKLTQGSFYTQNYPYFVPAVILTNYNIASVTVDFLLFNPLLNIISYNVLKFSFLPNAKTYKEIVTLSAIYNKLNIYFLISLPVFIILFITYITINVKKMTLVGFKLYIKSYYTKFFLIVSIIINFITLTIYLLSHSRLPNLNLEYKNGKYTINSLYSQIKEDKIAYFLHEMYITISNIELIKNIFICTTAITFALSCIVFLKHFGLLVKKYSNVEKNIKEDFLYPFFIILIIIFGCLAIFSVFCHKLFDISENISFSKIHIFIFNICIIFANFQGFNISSIVSEENILSYFYAIPILFFIVTISFSFIFFLAIKSFIKRNKKIYKSFIYQYSKLLRENKNKKNKEKKNGIFFDKFLRDVNYDYNLDENENIKNEKKKKENVEREDKTNKLNNEKNSTYINEGSDEDIENENHLKNKNEYLSDKNNKDSEDIYENSNDDSNENLRENSKYSSESSSGCEINIDEVNENLNVKDLVNVRNSSKNDKSIYYEKNNKKKNLFNIEKILDYFFNMNRSFLPFSYKEKKYILKNYKSKTSSGRLIFYIYLYTFLLLFVMLFIVNDYKKINESEKLLKYQIENIGYLPNDDLFINMQFYHIEKNINVNIKKKEFNFNQIEHKDDVIQWLKTCFISFLQNRSSTYGNDAKFHSTYMWKEIFNFKYHQGINIKITSREQIKIPNTKFICDVKLKNCEIYIENEKAKLVNTINDIALIINDSIQKIEISFILSDKINDYSILVNIHFIFISSGYISKNIFFGHLFFNSFNIFYFKGVAINILFFTMLLGLFIVIYLFLFKNFVSFYKVCSFVANGCDNNTASKIEKVNNLNNDNKEIENLDKHVNLNSNNYNYGNYNYGNYNYGDYNYGDYNNGNYNNGNYNNGNYNNGNYNYGNYNYGNYNFYDNYNNDDININNVNKKVTKIGSNFKLKIYLTYILENNILNFIIFPLHILIIAFWLVLSIDINWIINNTNKKNNHFNVHLNLFSYISYFINIFYLFIFLAIINKFIFLSNYFKKEILYEALHSNKKQIIKSTALLIFFYLIFTIFNFFFYGIDDFNDLSPRQYFIYSILILLGLVNIEIYLKCNIFYFLLIILPYLVLIRFLFIYAFFAPIFATYIILLRKKKKKKKKKVYDKKTDDNSSFTLTQLSNEQWSNLNEDIKQFARMETYNMLQFFEKLNHELKNNVDFSVILRNTSEKLNEKFYTFQLELRKIELQWKFRSKLLSSSMAYLEKLNNQISMQEEIIIENKNRILSLKQYLKQIKPDS